MTISIRLCFFKLYSTFHVFCETSRKMTIVCPFRIETIDGTAEANSDYVPMKDTLIFEPEETQKFIEIEIIDDNEWEPDEVFFVKLSLDSSDPSYNTSLMGRKAIMEVTIINDDGE